MPKLEKEPKGGLPHYGLGNWGFVIDVGQSAQKHLAGAVPLTSWATTRTPAQSPPKISKEKNRGGADE